MKRNEVTRSIVFVSCLLFLASLVSGCVVRSYTVTKPRVDQEISGNRGFIQGNIPASEQERQTKKERTIRVVEIELRSPIKFEGEPVQKIRPAEKSEDSDIWGNRGYITGQLRKGKGKVASATLRRKGKIVDYTVKKGDTLQKISKAFFGTVKKWPEIYELNKDKLKNSEKIYPGQVIKVRK